MQPFIGKSIINLLFFGAIVLLFACSKKVELSDETIGPLHLETLPEVKHPYSNPISPAKVTLGKALFYDPILSGEKDVSCATCHHPNFGYSDGRDLPIGVRGEGLGPDRVEALPGIPVVGRNAPTIINSAYNGMLNYHQNYDPLTGPMFWDGRMQSLESQSLGPPTSFNEMRGDAYAENATYDSIILRLKGIPDYVSLFDEAFGQGLNSITKENLGKAIACFERTIISKNSPYDQYVKGNKNALNEKQKQGLLLFFGKAQCANCHSGPMFSDFNFYNLGIRNNMKIDHDKGKDESLKFRTPTLRNITLTAPYMHNGTHVTLKNVMDYYNNGISENSIIPSVDVKIQPLNLTEEEMEAVIRFLEALTDPDFDKTPPFSVPSGLPVGGK